MGHSREVRGGARWTVGGMGDSLVGLNGPH